jgi:Cu2+-exporting ATPase
MPDSATAAFQLDTTAPLESACFHCGLPVPEGIPLPSLEVLGSEQAFCCHGCHAVCAAITRAGLDDYYRYRSETAVSAGESVTPEFIEQLGIYDRPDIQKDFVLHEGDSCEASLLLENIRCSACLWLNERHLRSLPGVLDVHIDDTTQRARVRWDPQVIPLSRILEAVTDIGYIAHPYDATRSDQLQSLRRRRSIERLIFAGVAGMPVMNFSLATYLMGDVDASGQLPLWITIGRWTSLLVTASILAYSAQDFFAGAWNNIRNRHLGMDIPVILGLSTAFLGSLHTLLTGHGEVYFDSIVMFVFFLLLARRWELHGKIRAANHLERLSRVTPRFANRLDSTGATHPVAVQDLVPGDRIRLLPGENVPLDGVLLDGCSSFDESLLTGEARPVLRQPGDEVVAGSVNGEQPVSIRVSRTLQFSAVSTIRKLVERALEQRPRYALLAERVASWFVAMLLVIATGTALYWLVTEPAQWLSNTIAVLIVTCPCALALATPVALAVSAGRFVELGVLPLGMRALDALAESDIFVFDKTGTLTTGQATVSEVVPTGPLDRSDCERHAAALCAHSEHPFARAVRKLVMDPRIEMDRIENLPGKGMRARIDGREWRLGKAEFATQNLAMTADMHALLEHCRAGGQSISLLSNPDGVQAVLIFKDPVRPGVVQMLSGLSRAGVGHFALLSGDTGHSVSRLGTLLGIEDCLSGMSPQDKLAWIRARQQEGHRIAMFGDGINDAPAMAAADVSLSFTDATDLANAGSDFLLLGSDATALPVARVLARRTQRIIRENLLWAACYNLLAVPFAAAGWIPPWGAALGMSFSSMFVVFNALRLQRTGLMNEQGRCDSDFSSPHPYGIDLAR